VAQRRCLVDGSARQLMKAVANGDTPRVGACIL